MPPWDDASSLGPYWLCRIRMGSSTKAYANEPLPVCFPPSFLLCCCVEAKISEVRRCARLSTELPTHFPQSGFKCLWFSGLFLSQVDIFPFVFQFCVWFIFNWPYHWSVVYLTQDCKVRFTELLFLFFWGEFLWLCLIFLASYIYYSSVLVHIYMFVVS